jgi:hypothetical protein
MATVLEERSNEEQRSVVLFLWAKGLNGKDINNDMFPLYGGKCLSRKVVNNWVANISLTTKRSKRRCVSGRDSSQNTSVLRFLTRWDKCIDVGGEHADNYTFFFSSFEYHMFCVSYPFVT